VIVAAAIILCQRNTVDLVNGKVSPAFYWLGPVLFSIGLQLTFVQTSTVFLYFNF
jgi:hypothetical protein